MEEEKAITVGEYQKLKDEMETIKKEQDDLLVLLADQDAKIDKYKSKLKELGQEIEDDDDDDDDLEPDDDDAD
ncbi:general vesicular transport factor p115 [Plakobranchus ocellatus]|uniref:General vesicular transport factor p115 n=1 Tax=Plakobranchus ocellatus TaxID=259542 RepID=A0AAV3YEW2_9GAST|nr:general vesicular transport factor p115 [Plakobranchus ocellatus]